MNTQIPLNRIYQKAIEQLNITHDKITSPEMGLSVVQPLIADTDREHFTVISLGTKNQILNIEIAHIGTLNNCAVHPREIFKNAILSNAAAIFIAHNHPSQNIQPSNEDRSFTKRLVDSGEILGIEVLDHIIINNNNEFYSMKAFGDI